jgi:hypothetical protein
MKTEQAVSGLYPDVDDDLSNLWHTISPTPFSNNSH